MSPENLQPSLYPPVRRYLFPDPCAYDLQVGAWSGKDAAVSRAALAATISLVMDDVLAHMFYYQANTCP